MRRRLIIVDEHTACRQMMTRVLSSDDSYDIVGETEDGRAALQLCKSNTPDIVILDLVLPGLCGKEVLRRIRLELPNVRVLVFTGTRNHFLIVDALRCHPHGFVDKRDSLSTFLEGLKVVASGKAFFSSFAANLLSDAYEAASSGLTQRELEVLQLVAESWSSKEIAARLGLSPKTVENHRANILGKLHLRDTAALTRYAARNGFVS